MASKKLLHETNEEQAETQDKQEDKREPPILTQMPPDQFTQEGGVVGGNNIAFRDQLDLRDRHRQRDTKIPPENHQRNEEHGELHQSSDGNDSDEPPSLLPRLPRDNTQEQQHLVSNELQIPPINNEINVPRLPIDSRLSVPRPPKLLRLPIDDRDRCYLSSYTYSNEQNVLPDDGSNGSLVANNTALVKVSSAALVVGNLYLSNEISNTTQTSQSID